VFSLSAVEFRFPACARRVTPAFSTFRTVSHRKMAANAPFLHLVRAL
jgi:hypothetical protein